MSSFTFDTWTTNITIALVVLSVCLLFLESKARTFIKGIPGPKAYPIVGNALQMRDPEGVMQKVIQWNQEYGSRFRTILGYFVYNFFLTDPKDIERVVNSQALIDKGNAYDFFHPWLGTGLVVGGGAKWHQRRRMLTPAFHFRILETFQQVFDEQSSVLVAVMKEKLQSNQEIGIHSLFSRCALDVICETAMGRKLNCQRETTPYMEAVVRQSQLVWQRWMSPWLHNDFMWSLSSAGKEEKVNLKILHDFTDTVIQERKEKFAAAQNEISPELRNANDEVESVYMTTKQRFAFLDLLLSVQESHENMLTDADIREETDTFMFEGHDTTAAALTWCLYLLAKNPEHQALVHSEMDAIFDSDKSRSIGYNDLPKMKYLDCCIKESLRLYPSVPFFSRAVTQAFKLDDDTLVPPGVDIAISPWLTHRNPTIYPEPEKFLPSRHTPENSAGRHPYAYIPFSAGLRNCIGQRFVQAEMKTILANVFRHYDVKLRDPSKAVIPLPELIVRPKEDINVILTMR